MNTYDRIIELEQWLSENAEEIIERNKLLNAWCEAYEDNDQEALAKAYKRTMDMYEHLNIALRQDVFQEIFGKKENE